MLNIVSDIQVGDCFLNNNDIFSYITNFLRLGKRWISNGLWWWTWRLRKDNSAEGFCTHSWCYSI